MDTKLEGFNPNGPAAKAAQAAQAAAEAAAGAAAAEFASGKTAPWASKTVWAAAGMAALPYIPAVNSWMNHNPETYGILSGVLMIVLRMFTAGGLRIK